MTLGGTLSFQPSPEVFALGAAARAYADIRYDRIAALFGRWHM
ncbi:hypothetical protein [Streptomyces sp. HUAS TT20]|nr:hypothetical protein [Streptomyces sp. HUAS 15-9]UXY31942.1 hypothetical protein N8I87_38950 [Streptomyces sp. HUAS 15-9]